ncbi:hypothetical protein IU433_06520 [Nocardia puris]|uniref:hypothetical protein n=1 Tax=Nocardia puris TaxID=208602 RepID=UPI0018962C60|nr:hypothetical protein [Nocardia puris]MBF6211188.1 hypothetical protein [Nocardia puris]MBF6364907.1 hypothetical protein [Nocardia puris]MBF6458693.1 hypothetical protein [Nocardia puris]
MSLFPAVVPNFTDPAAAPELQRRWRRARRLLYLSYIGIPALLVVWAGVAGVPEGRPVDAAGLAAGVVCAVCVAVPAVWALLWLYRKGIRDWLQWTRVMLSGYGQVAVAAVLFLALPGTNLSAFEVRTAIPGGLVVPMVGYICAGLARKRMTVPLCAELGDLDIDLVLTRQLEHRIDPMKHGVRAIIVYAYRDRIHWLDARGNLPLFPAERIEVSYADIAAVWPVHAPRDGTHRWYVSPDGYAWPPHHDQAVVLRTHRSPHPIAIPVDDAHAATEILTRRIHRLRTRAEAP